MMNEKLRFPAAARWLTLLSSVAAGWLILLFSIFLLLFLSSSLLTSAGIKITVQSGAFIALASLILIIAAPLSVYAARKIYVWLRPKARPTILVVFCVLAVIAVLSFPAVTNFTMVQETNGDVTR